MLAQQVAGFVIVEIISLQEYRSVFMDLEATSHW